VSPRAENTLAVVVCGVLLVAWIIQPGAVLLLIGAVIGGLALLAWVARKLRI
jgi:hypothetical protein